MRSTELRVQSVKPDETRAARSSASAAATPVRIIANRPDPGDAKEYDHKLREACESHHLTAGERGAVRGGAAGRRLGVQRHALRVTGVDGRAGHHVLRCVSPAIPNAIAALLLYMPRSRPARIPHAYFGWTEGNPIAYLLKFLAFGEGRYRAGDARSASPDRGRSDAPSSHSRRLVVAAPPAPARTALTLPQGEA